MSQNDSNRDLCAFVCYGHFKISNSGSLYLSANFKFKPFETH